MRKRIGDQAPSHTRSTSPGSWLDLEQIATVEVTSEDPNFPIESIFNGGDGRGWRALEIGEQQIRLIFDQPVSISRIRLRLIETELERTQEFAVSWSGTEGGPPKEIVRQQWNFSPDASPIEIENYRTSLDGVATLELSIKPDLKRQDIRASIAEWRIA